MNRKNIPAHPLITLGRNLEDGICNLIGFLTVVEIWILFVIFRSYQGHSKSFQFFEIDFTRNLKADTVEISLLNIHIFMFHQNRGYLQKKLYLKFHKSKVPIVIKQSRTIKSSAVMVNHK